MWDEEFDVAQAPKVAYARAAQVSNQGDIRNKNANYNNENQGCGPGRDLIRSDAVGC